MTHGNRLVSVVVPFFKPDARFLREAVQSVAAQTYRDWEIVMVDDGSPPCEGSREAHALAAAMGDRVRVVTYDSPRNRGISAARNEGVRHAKGAYISWLDADDVWFPEKLQIEVAGIESVPDAGMAYSAFKFWYDWTGNAKDAELSWIPRLGVEPRLPIPPPEFVTKFVGGRTTVPTPSCTTFRRAAFDAVGGCEIAFPGLYEDQVLFAKIGVGYPVIALPEVTTLYRQHDSSICATAQIDIERAARTRFLSWLAKYLHDASIADTALTTVVRAERWKVEHPRLARMHRFVLKRRRRIRQLLQRT